MSQQFDVTQRETMKKNRENNLIFILYEDMKQKKKTKKKRMKHEYCSSAFLDAGEY